MPFRHSRLAAALAVLILDLTSLNAADAAAATVWKHYAAQSHKAVSRSNRDGPESPAPDPSLAEIKFNDFFGPIGERGLEYSATLRRLAGKRVRITGFMVREQMHAPGVCMLAAWPQSVETSGLCYYDDLPASVVHIVMAGSAAQTPIPYVPGRLALSGTLEIGSRAEADGRNSAVRLIVDADSLGIRTAVRAPVAAISTDTAK